MRVLEVPSVFFAKNKYWMVKGAYFKASKEPVLIQRGPSLDPVMK